MTTPTDRDLPIAEWNDTDVDYELDVCVHEQFRRQVSLTPHLPALRFGNDEWTYDQLNRRSNQIAHRLIELGIRPGSRVGIACERSLEVVAGFLAILKAGAAYVPLDANDPRERRGKMLRDAEVEVVVTHPELSAKFPDHTVLAIDRAGRALEHLSEGEPGVEASADPLAYVLYTSGSTGEPKGVMIHHRALTNRLAWMQDRYRLTVDDRILQKTPFTFDVSGWELFWPLLHGACLVLARPGGHRDTAYLIDCMARQGITIAHFVPSLLDVFLDDPNVKRCTSLRQVICSGEELRYELQCRFFERLPGDLDNLYGPTEAAIDVTAWRCSRDAEPGPVPIGRPVANTRLYVLGPDGAPVSVGDSGELHIGGVQVGRGYVNRPELTAQQFVEDPFVPGSDARLYKTGDRARWRPDGNLEFLGRMDRQVKLRGMRMELGEIEHALAGFPGIRRVVAQVRNDAGQDPQLVAYLIPEPGHRRDTGEETWGDEVRRHAARRLPEAMIPAFFTLLEDVPIGPTGKLDHAALPAPVGAHALDLQSDGPPTEPTGDLRSFLVHQWCEVLGRSNVGLRERFFDLGGTSLQAARVINAVQTRLGEQIFVVAFYEAPTIEAFETLLLDQYPDAVGRAFSLAKSSREGGHARVHPSRAPVIDEDDVRQFLARLPTSPARRHAVDDPRNPPAIFLLSTHRSGTTLLRAMLAGHPQIFAASELQLLRFETMSERRSALRGPKALWLEGAIRAVMEIECCDAEAARRTMEEFEAEGTTTAAFLRWMQDRVAPRILLDKTPTDALDPNALHRMEALFETPRYIHLVRDPSAMIRSAREFHMEQIWGLDGALESGSRLAELVWNATHRCIADFLATVPEQRWTRLRFEDLVRRPRETLMTLCENLDLPFHPDLLHPYEGRERKMLDGIHPESMPMGDTKFHTHGRIDATVADRGTSDSHVLGEVTHNLARRWGYAPPPIQTAVPSAPKPIAARSPRTQAFEHQRTRRQRHRRPQQG